MPHPLIRCAALLLFSLGLLSCAPAADTPQAELTRLCNEAAEAERRHSAKLSELEADVPAARRYHAQHDPGPAHIARMLAFEREHRGTQVGLMAVREIFLEAGRTWEYRAAATAKGELLPTLPAYAGLPELPEVLSDLQNGAYEPALGRAFDRLRRQDTLPAGDRPFVRFLQAQSTLKVAENARYFRKRLSDLDAGAKPDFPNERDRSEKLAARFPPADELAAAADRALAELGTLIDDPTAATARQPAVRRVDDNRHLIAYDPDATRSAPTVRDLADGLLFRTLHLQPGRSAPELNLTLIDGEPWSLADERGKAVVVMFTFRGCGPCERVYPVLDAVRAAHPGRVETLFITTDVDRNDTLTSIADGKLKGSVHWDGDDGPLATRWAVKYFPTLFVISPQGQIAGGIIQGEDPEATVAAFADLLHSP